MPISSSLIVGAARTVGREVVKRLDPAELIRVRFDAAIAEADRELMEIATSVATGLFFHAIGRPPSHDERSALLEAALQGPARVHRLLGEARKTSSRDRRRLLAAILIGLCFSDMTEQDRDRVDMLVERLTFADITLLGAIRSYELDDREDLDDWRRGLFAVRIGSAVRIVPGHLVPGGTFDDDLLHVPNLPSDRVALGQLQALGLVELDSGNQHGAVTVSNRVGQVNGIATTPLAHLLLDALDEVRPGLENSPPP